MGNCCVVPSSSSQREKQEKKKKKNKPNPFSVAYGANGSGGGSKLRVLKEPTGQDISQKYDMGRELGRGEFGVTYLFTDTDSGEKLACKSISKTKLRTSVDIEDVRREVEIMKHMPKHPNIVSLKDTYEDENAVHIVMELCEGGELFDRIVARGHYTERAAAAVMQTIVQVVQMCHRHGVMHRDLKPENFLFGNKKETAPLKAIDFGLSVFFKPGERFNEIVGSPYYMAPEVLRRNYGPEVDVWSAGVILYILLCGVPPFWAETEQGVAQAIIRSVIDFKRDPWPKVSDNAKDLVKKMLNPDPKQRLTAQGVLDHPWLQNAKKAPNVSLGEVVKSRLKQFSVMNKLKKRALRVVAEHLSGEEVAGIKEAFDMMDTSKRNKINLEELRIGLQKLGHHVPDADLQILMEAAGVDGDGTLNYAEFVAVSVHLRKMANDEHLHKAFAFFDQNKSGYIEIEELRHALSDEDDANSEEVISAIMHDVDTDKNSIPPKGSEMNLTLGGIDLNSSGSVVVKADKKLLTVLFPDGRDGRAFTLKAETSEDLFEWKAALEEALANAPSATLVTEKNGILKNELPDAADAPLEQSKDRQRAKSLVIGRPILLALEDIDGTPSFLEKALRFLEEHGVKVEGVLRQAADVDDVEHRIREFEQGKNEFSPNEDPHVIADCIKYIIRELPSSPVPASCCNALLEAFRTDRGKRVSAMRAAICETFPEPNRRLLQRILMMMQTVASHKAVNRMSTSAVAACMAPLLLRPLLAGDCELENDFDMDGDGSVQLLQAAAAANHAQAIVITLLEEYDNFFGEGSMSSELYSDSEASGSESEELSDNGSFEDDGEDDPTEGSDADLDEDFKHASSGSCTETGDSEDNNLYDDKMQGSKSPEVDDNLEAGLKLSSCPPQNSVYQHDVGESEHILNHSTSSSAVQANASGEVVWEVLVESSPENHLTNKSASTCIQKTATLSNGPGHSTRRPAQWGRTPGRKNLSMESIEFGCEDEVEIERLEVIKTELQSRIAEEAKENAILQGNLEKHKNALYERRLTLKQDVARLQEQLQKEIELRTALETGLKVSEGISPIDGRVKAEVEDIAQAEADVTNLKEKADDVAVQLDQQNEQNCDFIPDACILPEKYTNHQGKLKDKQKDLEATSTNRSFDMSTRNKGQSNKAETEKDVKQAPSSINKNAPQNQQSDPVHNSKYAGIPPTSSSAESVTAGKPATINSKRQGTRGEGATSTTSALSKLTNRLNFLKERRTQIASEIQKFDKGRTPDQPAQNSEGHSSDKNRGADQNSEGPSASSALTVQNLDWRRRSDGLASPDLERGKSEGFPNMDKGQIPSRTFSR